MKRAPVILAALVVAGVVTAGGYGVGSGGLQGPAPVSVSGSGSQLGPGCVTTPTGINCAGVDAGSLNVQANANINGTTLHGGSVTMASNTDINFGANTTMQMASGSVIRVVTGVAVTRAAPTLTGFCTSPSVTWSSGSMAFQIDVGTSCTGVSTGTINLTSAGASGGWQCHCTNLTATATRNIDQAAGTATTVPITNYVRTTGVAGDFADGADIRCQCAGGAP